MVSINRSVSLLSDQEIFGILDLVIGELADDTTPEGTKDQIGALAAALATHGATPAVDQIVDASPERMAEAARELVTLMGSTPEVAALVGAEIADPPRPENASAELLIAAPLVITACVVLLQVVGHTHFERSSDGKWSVSYDPSKKAPLDDVLKDLAKLLADLIRR